MKITHLSIAESHFQMTSSKAYNHDSRRKHVRTNVEELKYVHFNTLTELRSLHAQPLLSVVGSTLKCISHKQDQFIPQPSLNAVGTTRGGISTQTCSFRLSYEKF